MKQVNLISAICAVAICFFVLTVLRATLAPDTRFTLLLSIALVSLWLLWVRFGDRFNG